MIRGGIMRLALTIKEQQKWDKFWRDLAFLGELGNKEAALLADAARRGLALNWESESSPYGEKWQRLAPMTQTVRSESGFAPRHPILKRTGDLQRSFTDANHPRHVFQVGRLAGQTVVVIGARENPQTPGRIPLLDRGGLNLTLRYVPPRPFIGFSDQALRWIEGQADAIILQRVERLKTKQ